MSELQSKPDAAELDTGQAKSSWVLFYYPSRVQPVDCKSTRLQHSAFRVKLKPSELSRVDFQANRVQPIVFLANAVQPSGMQAKAESSRVSDQPRSKAQPKPSPTATEVEA